MTTETDVAVAFLRRVLPATGSYFYRYKPGAKKIWMAVSPANSVEQLWSRMQDAGGNLDAGDVYYSTASFDCQDQSDAAHVVAKKAFYVDVEVGAAYVKKGTGYDDQRAAIRARQCELPFATGCETALEPLFERIHRVRGLFARRGATRQPA